MENQKLEGLLNLALSADEKERSESLQLMTGYDPVTKEWELIVKYHGDLKQYETEGLRIELLIAGYAIVTIAEAGIEAFSRLEEVEYVEKPKSLYFSLLQAKRLSCVLEVTQREPFLTGKGVLIGVIDSGIDYRSAEFQNERGESRIRYLWDQSLSQRGEERPPAGFYDGVEFDQETINRALTSAFPEEIVPSFDYSGHGTMVSTIAAASGKLLDGQLQGVAWESELLVVKLGRARENSFPRTVELMKALTYVVQKAQELKQPLAINLSFGNTYGAHDGTSLLERFLNNIAEIGRTAICVGSGNEGAREGHATGTVEKGQIRQVELQVGAYQMAFGVQLWLAYRRGLELAILTPQGERYEIPVREGETQRLRMGSTQLLLYIGAPSPYSVKQEIYFDFLPTGNFVEQGIWTFELRSEESVPGRYDFYLPSGEARNTSTRFFIPTPERTLTIPSTASRVITVGAYDDRTDGYAEFSGRGGSISGTQKPDLSAPGVDLMTMLPGNELVLASGTSFATPLVTGSCALLMEWGIVRGRDPYLYGEKLKAYLRKGARSLRGESSYPNEKSGYGALCVKDSLPEQG